VVEIVKAGPFRPKAIETSLEQEAELEAEMV